MVNSEILKRLVERVTVTAGERSSIEVRTPLTGEFLGDVPACNESDVDAAVSAARLAQADWKRRTYRDRAKVFTRFHDLVLERQDEVLDLIQLESGKARHHAFEEVADVAIVCRYYAYHGARHIRSERRRGALPFLTSTTVHHHPRGVIGFIEPWNYPLSMGITDAIPALLAGNGAIIKPDSQTPFTALWAAELLYEAGLPEGLLHITTGSGRELGGPIIDRVDYICFTGSTATGRIIARQAGERLIGCSLELGGKNALIICDDADLDRAIDGSIRACYASGGQLCISTERVFVQDQVYDTFVDRFVSRVSEMSLGADLTYSADMGSIVSEAQFATVKGHVDDAVAKGATVLVGGEPRPEVGPLFYAPTVLTGVTSEMDVYANETFGPVVSVYRFDSRDEVVDRANDSEYGLNTSIWTRDTESGEDMASRIAAGTANINEAYAAAWGSMDAPMGGFKDSGLSRRHGAEGIRKYTESQTVATQRLLPIAPPPGVSERRYAAQLTQVLKILRRIPGLR